MNKPIDPKLYGGKDTQSALAISLKPIKPGQKRQIIRVPESELPLAKELGPQEVLCMIYMTQICDTDIELGTNAGHGAPTIGFTDEDGDGLVLNGHEAGAVVIAVGEEVDRVKIGDWASLKVREGMKSSECIMCQADMSHRCLNWQYDPADMEEHGIFRAPGWFCQYSVLDQRQVIKIPDGLVE
jgi:D-arabinose 1-dehydrogenase-like Zn-dependent alcohol dehydrogenase